MISFTAICLLYRRSSLLPDCNVSVLDSPEKLYSPPHMDLRAAPSVFDLAQSLQILGQEVR